MRITILLIIGLCALASNVLAQVPPPYRLAPEDVLVITVLKHPEFSGQLLVPPDGQLNVPGVGAVNVIGKTVEELTQYLTRALQSRIAQT